MLKTGAEVLKSVAVNTDECYVCMLLWEKITDRVLVPACRHAVCVPCAMSLRQVERNERKNARRSLKQNEAVKCGYCRQETIVHVK